MRNIDWNGFNVAIINRNYQKDYTYVYERSGDDKQRYVTMIVLSDFLKLLFVILLYVSIVLCFDISAAYNLPQIKHIEESFCGAIVF